MPGDRVGRELARNVSTEGRQSGRANSGRSSAWTMGAVGMWMGLWGWGGGTGGAGLEVRAGAE